MATGRTWALDINKINKIKSCTHTAPLYKQNRWWAEVTQPPKQNKTEFTLYVTINEGIWENPKAASSQEEISVS